jgi:hypothetical protein
MIMTKDPKRTSRLTLQFSLGSAFIGIAVITAMLIGIAN